MYDIRWKQFIQFSFLIANVAILLATVFVVSINQLVDYDGLLLQILYSDWLSYPKSTTNYVIKNYPYY